MGQTRDRKRSHCPVCDEAASQLEYRHTEFRHVRVRVCRKCGHGYTDRDFEINQPGLWHTNQERADYYLSDVIPTWVKNPQGKRFLEIGVCDFYLLLKLHALYPALSLYAYDKYPAESPPVHITFTRSLADVTQIDYVLSLHTLEHIYDLDTFLTELSKSLAKDAILIIEVPSNSITKHREVQCGKHITGYHFHFFNESSFIQIIGAHGFKPLMISTYGPDKWQLNGINLLGVFQYVSNYNIKYQDD